MKKLYAIIVLLGMPSWSFSQIINFPDPNFESALLNHNPVIDVNSNGLIEVSEAQAVATLNLNNKNISSLDGIENFTGLTTVNCDDNHLSSFSYNLPNLTNFNGYNNQLTSFDTTHLPMLYSLGVGNNLLTSIDLQNCPNLYGFYCPGNLFSSITLCGTQTAWLECSNNPNLTNVSVKNNVISIVLWGDPPLGMFFFFDCPLLTSICYDPDELEAVQWSLIGSNNVNLVTDCSANCVPLAATPFQAESFSIAPNPVGDILQISTNDAATTRTISIYNSIGQFVKSISPRADASMALDVSTLPSGVYSIAMDSEHGKAVKKFVKT